MKRAFVFCLIMVFALSAVALAAPKKAEAVPSTPAPAPVAAAGDAWSGKVAVGNIGAFPAIKYHFNKDVMGALGINYFSAAGGSTMTILGKLDYTLATVGEVQTLVGGYIGQTSFAGGGNSTTFGLTWGVRTLVASNLAVGADMIVFNSTSAGGTSTTGILPGTFVNFGYYF